MEQLDEETGWVWQLADEQHDDIHLAFENPTFMTGRPGKNYSRQQRPIKELFIFVGALIYWGITRCDQVVAYDVGVVKEGIAGSKGASKDKVEEAIRLDPDFGGKFGGQDLTDHEWDALSVAVYHVAQLRISSQEIHGDPRARGGR